MSYLSSNRSTNSMKPPTSHQTSNQSGFESKFSDLAMAACPPNSKRARTSFPSRQTTPKKSANITKTKTPLKFDFKPHNQTTGPIAAPMAPPTAFGPRYVSKPVLASQARGPNIATPVVIEPDWGDDADEDILLAASQMVETGPTEKETEEDDLLAMTAMLEDDFAFDDVEFEETMVEEVEKEEERLNQTMTVFESERKQSTAAASASVFKLPPNILPKVKVEAESRKGREEEEKFRALHLKSQGEATMLREELKKKDREVDVEKLEKRRIEAELKDVIKDQKIRSELEVSAVKTEKIFLLQEIQQLKEKVQKVEANSSKIQRVETAPKPGNRSKPSHPLGKEKQEMKPFPIEKEFSSKSIKSETSTAHTQTEGRPTRKCRLQRPRPTWSQQAATFCRVSKVDNKDKARILQTVTKADTGREVSRTIKSMIQLLNNLSLKPLEDDQLVGHLRSINIYLGSCSNIATFEERRAVTEVCSNLLTCMLRTENFLSLVPTLSLLVTAWSPGLQAPDITSYLLSLLSQVVHRGKPASSRCRVPVTAPLVSLVVRLVELVSRDGEQASLLCKQTINDCFLFTLTYLLHQGLASSTEVQAAACSALVRWVLVCSCLPHHLPFLDNSCTWCTGDLVRILTNATHGQVKQLLDTPDTKEKNSQTSLLISCVRAMVRTQDIFSREGRLDEWVKGMEKAASVQRRYIWTVERISSMDLKEPVVSRLADLQVSDSSVDYS